jgi:hypothetical protein
VWTPLSSTKTDDAGTYYTLLAEALWSGDLNISIAPSAELLALEDPYDPVKNERYRLHDASLFEGKYYLYFGLPPAVVAVPTLISGHRIDIRATAAVVALIACGLSLATLRTLLPGRRLSPNLTLLSLCAIGTGTLFPIALRRVAVYEVALITAAALTMASLLALFHAAKPGGQEAKRRLLFLASGTLAGLAVWTRPTMIAAVVMSCIVLAAVYSSWTRRTTALLFYITPVAAVGGTAAMYNLARFRSFTEFGHNYQLTGTAGIGALRPSTLADILEKLQTDLLSLPERVPGFPFLVLASPKGSPETQQFFSESAIGLLWVFPAAVPALLIFAYNLRGRGLFLDRTSVCCLSLAVTAAAVLIAQGVAISATSFRYLLEVSPLIVVFALSILIRALHGTQVQRILARLGLASIMFVTVPLAIVLSLTGYYDTLRSGSPRVWQFLESISQVLT